MGQRGLFRIRYGSASVRRRVDWEAAFFKPLRLGTPDRWKSYFLLLPAV